MSSPPDMKAGPPDFADFIFASVILIWAIFFLSGIFSLPLMPPDEPKYAFAASKMLETGDFITPTFNCEPRFDKPPLVYWLIAASFRLFGVSDWAARIPALLATLGVMLVMYRECKKRFDNWTALLAVIVFANLLHVWVMGRAVAPETLLVFFEVAAIFSFSRGIEEERKRNIYYGYIFLALAFLTKGPVGLIVPCGVVFLYYSYRKGVLYTARKFLNPVGIALFLILGLPWYVAMFKIHGYRYFEEFFLFHNVYRFTGQARQHPFRFYYYVPVIVGSLYLWLPFSREICSHIMQVFREKSGEMFFVFWAAFVLIFFSASVNKLHNYVLIASPPIAIVIGHALRRTASIGRSVRGIYAGVAVVEILGLAYAAFCAKGMSAAVLLGGLFVVFTTLFTIARGNRLDKMVSLVVTKGVAILMTVTLFMAGYESRIKTASALVLLEVMFEKSPVYFYKKESEDVVFYANRCISKLDTKEELETAIRSHDELVLFFAGEGDLADLGGVKTDVVVPFDDISGRKRYLVEIDRRGSP